MTIVTAGLVAGVVNAIVGSGSLLTFPALLAARYSPFHCGLRLARNASTPSLKSADV